MYCMQNWVEQSADNEHHFEISHIVKWLEGFHAHNLFSVVTENAQYQHNGRMHSHDYGYWKWAYHLPWRWQKWTSITLHNCRESVRDDKQSESKQANPLWHNNFLQQLLQTNISASMKNSDIDQINRLLAENKWLADSVNAILSKVPTDKAIELTSAGGFILFLRALLRTSVRVQEMFGAKESTASPNDPRFIRALERLLREHMSWIKPLVERYSLPDAIVPLKSSIEQLFGTDEECIACEF